MINYIKLSILTLVIFMLSACHAREGGDDPDREREKIVTTSPLRKDVTFARQFVCQIHARKQINVRALQTGYLEAIGIREGQLVKEGDVLFKVVPAIYKAKYDAAKADVKLAQIEYDNTKALYNSPKGRVVSEQEVLEYAAKLAKAEAKQTLAEAEFNFTMVKSPFDGIIDRLYEQQGSLVKEGDNLTALSDNSVMWVYFNVPEARYLNYMDDLGLVQNDQEDYQHRMEFFLSELNRRARIELVLANGRAFSKAGKISTVEAKFNNETGNIAFRADFPNPNRLLRHGQTGKVLIHQSLPGAIVIPVRATFQILDKRYVYVVGDGDVVRQREVTVQHEMDDVFIVKAGLDVKDRIVLDGVQQVRDGDKVEGAEFRAPEDVLKHQKFHAE